MGIEQDEADIQEIFDAQLTPLDPGLFDEEDIGQIDDESYRAKAQQPGLIAKVSSTHRLHSQKIENDRYDTFGDNDNSSKKVLQTSQFSSNAKMIF